MRRPIKPTSNQHVNANHPIHGLGYRSSFAFSRILATSIGRWHAHARPYSNNLLTRAYLEREVRVHLQCSCTCTHARSRSRKINSCHHNIIYIVVWWLHTAEHIEFRAPPAKTKTSNIALPSQGKSYYPPPSHFPRTSIFESSIFGS